VLLHILAGVKYTFGKGVLKDYKQAVYWYQKAADQGDAKAQLFDTKTQLAYRLLTPLCH
jgi:TPR repeat protein